MKLILLTYLEFLRVYKLKSFIKLYDQAFKFVNSKKCTQAIARKTFTLPRALASNAIKRS